MKANAQLKLTSLILDGIKDVEHGEIKFPIFEQTGFEENPEEDFASVIGVYGSNGSGKTALIDAMALLKSLIWENDDPKKKDNNLLCIWAKQSSVEYNFLMKDGDVLAKVRYKITMCRSANSQTFEMGKETLSYALYDKEKGKYQTLLTPLEIDYEHNGISAILSKKAYLKIECLFEDKGAFDKAVALQTLKNECRSSCKSMLFSSKLMDILKETNNANAIDALDILRSFQKLLKHGLFVYSNAMDASSTMGLSPIMGIAKGETGDELGYGTLGMPLEDPFEISEDDLPHYQSLIAQINILLKAFVPNFSSRLEILETRLNPSKQKEGPYKKYKVQYVRIVEGQPIPFSAESNGLKKLVNIASALIAAYSSPSVILAIDEFDSGIFEYLLAQILQVVGAGMKGQLLFTAHNCTALSVLDKSQLYFSTVNPKNRYIKLRNMQTENNPESFYRRALKIGGQKEKLMDPTHASEISRALRKGFLQGEDSK